MTACEDVYDGQLGRLAVIAADIGAERLSRDALTAAERVIDGRFYVACLGQFKRGKSTLLNALIGQAILPTAILPVTAVPTVLRYGPALRMRIRFTDDTIADRPVTEIESYVSEELNPENAKHVDIVEVFVPSQLLAEGMCLVDTPGIGSIFTTNSATTHAFIPRIDVALVVVGADPPISGEELALVEQVARAVPDVIVVLNKADKITSAECEQAVEFTSRVITRRLQRPLGSVHAVSATEQLASSGPSRDWSALVLSLRRLIGTAHRAIVDDSAGRAIERISQACLAEIDMMLLALREPIEDTNRRMAALQQHIANVEFHLPRLNALIGVEQQQIARVLSERSESFLAATLPAAFVELRRRISASLGPYVGSAGLRNRAIATARTVAREQLEPWFTREERFAERLYRDSALRFVNLANAFLSELAMDAIENRGGETASPLASRPLDSDGALTTVSHFYFHDVESLVRAMSPLARLRDRTRSQVTMLRAAEKQAEWYLEQLLRINSTRVRNDIDDRIRESARRLESEIRSCLHDVLTSADHMIQRAQATRTEGAERVVREIARLEASRAEVSSIRQAAHGARMAGGKGHDAP